MWLNFVQIQNQCPCKFDTGASASVINEAVYKWIGRVEQKLQLQATQAVLKIYTGEQIPVSGIFNVVVVCAGKQKKLPLSGNEGDIALSFGMGLAEWNSDKLVWNKVFAPKDLDKLLQKYSEVFQEGLEKITGVKARIEIHTHITPWYFKQRFEPCALQNKIEVELEWLQSDNIMEPAKFYEWAAPIVPVLKPDGSIRICRDIQSDSE